MFFFLTVAFANVSLFKPQLILKAQVSSADTLAPGGDVDVAGVKVGAIQKIEKSNTGALVTMAVDPAKVAVYRDTRVVIRPHGVFGPKFAEVNPGTVQAGAFQSGDAIQIDHTAVSVDFEQVLDELDPNTRMGLQTALYELGKGSEGRGEDWGVVIDSLKTITTHLTPALQVVDSRQVELSRFLDNNAIVVETYGNAPIDSLVRENADILAKLDSHRAEGSDPARPLHPLQQRPWLRHQQPGARGHPPQRPDPE
jgi:virulence factor Mce-like protein